MQPTRWPFLAAGAVLIVAGLGAGELRAEPAAEGRPETPEQLQQRVLELEQSTREQVESLKRKIEELEAARERERRLQEAERRAQEAQAATGGGPREFFDLQAGAKQGAASETAPLGKDLKGNVYTGDNFKVRLGGSLRMHAQRNSEGVGESVSRALLPGPGSSERSRDERDNFRAFAGRTRINMAIEGPVTLGGRTSGLFEFDFNRQLSNGVAGAVNNNPRLRHAFARWAFPDLLAKGDEFVVTFGQTGSFADNVPDTVDFNTMLGGLGAALRRNPRIELLHRYPLASTFKFVSSIGAERPFFGNDVLGGGANDLGPGEVSAFPAASAGIGLEAGRIGDGFGIGSSRFYVRYTWGRFEERFDATTGAAAFDATSNFIEQHFTNQTIWGTFTLDRIGFNPKGRALTLQLRGGGLWTQGEARHLNAEFDRRTIRNADGSLDEAESYGGFVNPIFFLTDTISVRWAGGIQFARDNDRPAASGAFIDGFFRTKNRQSEASVWWTPGPFTFALAWNQTETDFKRNTLAETRSGAVNKIELITFFSF